MTGTARLRPILGAVGALAGFAYYALFEEEVLRDAPVHLQRLAIYFAVAFFPAFGLMAGPLRMPRAAAYAAGLAVVAAALAAWAAMRFPEELTRHWELLEPTGEGLIIVPFLLVAALAVPVLTAAGQAPGGWHVQARLLPLGWTAAVRIIVTLLFLGLFWGVYFLSHTLLELVGVDILETLVEWDPGFYVISGAVTGLALAVTCEMESIIATVVALFLRLLRLLLVPVAAVMALFVLATAVQGLDAVFANRSAATTMMSMAGGAVLLIAAALHFHEQEDRTPSAVLWSARVMGAVLPVVAAIAAYAVWIRVGDYGWTPQRILAAICAGIVAGFVLPVTLFAIAARPGWQDRTLGGFVWALLGALVMGVLWFTPALNAQRIAAASQLSRLLSGTANPAEYDYWPLARHWGTAGQAALKTFRESGVPQAVAERIAAAQTAESRWQAVEAQAGISNAALWSQVATAIERLPDGAPLPRPEELEPDVLARLRPDHLTGICGEGTPLPRCIALKGDFLPRSTGDEWLILAQGAPGQRLETWFLRSQNPGPWMLDAFVYRPGVQTGEDVIAALRDGGFNWITPDIRGIEIGGIRMLPKEED